MKKTFLVFLSSLALMLAVSPLRDWSLPLSIMIETPLFAIFTYWLLAKVNVERKGLLALAVLLGRIALEIPLRIISFESSLISILCPICCCLGIAAAYLFWKNKHKYGWAITLFTVFWLYCVFDGVERLAHFKNFGTTYHTVNAAHLHLYKTDKDSIRLGDLTQKYIVMDVWNTSCGVCIRKMPEFQAIYERYKDNPSVWFSSVLLINERKNNDKELGDSIVRARQCDFPIHYLSQSRKEEFRNTCKIKVFPTLLILDQERNIIFRGNTEKLKQKLEELLETSPR